MPITPTPPTTSTTLNWRDNEASIRARDGIVQTLNTYEAESHIEEGSPEEIAAKREGRKSVLGGANERSVVQVIIQPDVKPDLTALREKFDHLLMGFDTEKNVNLEVFQEYVASLEREMKSLKEEKEASQVEKEAARKKEQAAQIENESLKVKVQFLEAENRKQKEKLENSEKIEETDSTVNTDDINILNSKDFAISSCIAAPSHIIGQYLGKLEKYGFNFLGFSIDGNWIICRDTKKLNKVFLLDTKNLDSYKVFDLEKHETRYFPSIQIKQQSKKYLSVITNDSNIIIIWEIEKSDKPYKILEKPGHNYEFTAISPDLEWVVYENKHEEDKNKVKLKRIDDKTPARIIECANKDKRFAWISFKISPIFLPNSKWIISVGESTVNVYSLENSAQEPIILKPNDGEIRALTTSEDGETIAAVSVSIIEDKPQYLYSLWKTQNVIEEQSITPFFQFELNFPRVVKFIEKVFPNIALSQNGEWFAFPDDEQKQIQIFRINSDLSTSKYALPYTYIEKFLVWVKRVVWQQIDADADLIVYGANDQVCRIPSSALLDFFSNKIQLAKDAEEEKILAMIRKFPLFVEFAPDSQFP